MLSCFWWFWRQQILVLHDQTLLQPTKQKSKYFLKNIWKIILNLVVKYYHRLLWNKQEIALWRKVHQRTYQSMKIFAESFQFEQHFFPITHSLLLTPQELNFQVSTLNMPIPTINKLNKLIRNSSCNFKLICNKVGKTNSTFIKKTLKTKNW